MKTTWLLFCVLVCTSLFAEPAYITFPSDVPWVTRQSPHFVALYREGQDNLAKRSLKAAERAHRLLTTIFKEAPEKTWLVLADFHDTTNGYALNFPYPHIVVYVTPPESASQLSPLDDWLDSVILHEMTHIVHLYPAHGVWGIMRTIFGTWVVPNGLMPNHFHEGMATFMETHFTKGGRGRGPLYKMYRRMAVEEGVWGHGFTEMDILDGSAIRWPHGTSAYFFGYTLTEELHRRKGMAGFWDLTLSYSDNWPYLIHGPAKEIYGQNYDEIWESIYRKGESEAKSEIVAIKQKGVAPLHYLTDSKFYKWDTALSSDGREVIFRSISPFKLKTLEVMDTSNGQTLDSITVDASPAEGLCFLGDSVLFSNATDSNGHSENKLFLWNRKQKNTRSVSVTSGSLGNVRHLSCANSSKGILAQESGGVGELKEFSRKENQITFTREWRIPEGSWVNGLLALENETWILLRENYETHLYYWGSEKTPNRVTTIPARLSMPRKLGKSSDSFLVLADIDERNEIWEVFPRRGEIRKRLNILGGLNAFDVSAVANDKIVAASYRHGGYDVATASLSSGPTQKIPSIRTTSSQDAENVAISEVENYSPLGSLLPRAWVPSVLFVPDGLQFGVWVPGFDISQRHFFDLVAGYDTRKGGLPFALFGYNYRFGGSYSLDFSPYYSPSYLLQFTDFLKRWGGSVGLSSTALPISIRLSALFRQMEQSPLTPNSLRSVGVGVTLGYKLGFEKRPYAISPVNGIKLGLTHEQFLTTLGSEDNFFSSVASLDQYWAAPWWQDSVFYIGSKMGYTEGTNFYNSYFEGGGELLFQQSRGSFLNRGFSPGTFIGRRILNITTEYRFPISRVERGWGLSPFFLNDIHAALVADTTTIDFGVSSSLPKDFLKVFYASAGVELRSRWKVSYYLPASLRIGAYRGFGDLRAAQDFYFTIGAEAGL